MVGPLDEYCGHNSVSSIFWPIQQQQQQQLQCQNYDDSDHYFFSSPSPSVDCTLSLATPSTRLSTTSTHPHAHAHAHEKPTPRRNRNSVSAFCWDLFHPSPSTKPPSKPHPTSSDPLLPRRCANCDTTSTPLWRNGPRGPKSLCNACGIRFKKEERRAAAATTAAPHNGAAMMDPHNGYYNGSLAHPYEEAGPQKMQCFGAPNEFRLFNDDRGSDPSIQFLSWLTHDRPTGLVHHFTR